MEKMWDNTSAQKTVMSSITMPHGGGRFRGLASRLSYLRKQSKSGLRSNEGKWKAYSCSVGIFAFSFVITLLIASLLTPTTITSAEENSSSSAQADGYSLSLSATSAVNLGLSVSDSDSMTVGLGNVSVTTTSPGYKLYISMTGDTTGLSGIADGISGNIPATSGTITSPTSLTRGTWGYAIPSSGVAHLVSSGFNTSYAEMSSTTPDSSKKFATPPVSSAPQLIAESSTAASSDNYPIYYGVRANADTAPGDYSNTVMFTAVADAAVSDTLTLTPSSVNINTATTVTVKTSLYSTAGYANANIYFLTAAEKNSIVGTNVEALGKTPLTCSKTSNTPVTYSCSLPSQTTPGTYYVYAKFPTYDKAYSSAFIVINPTYTVTVTNSNTTSGAASVQVPLNGSATVTVIPASSYYLSAVSCPSGYTCTGYTTGTSATDLQTVTVANNNTTAGGTLAFTGTEYVPPTYSTPQQGCSAVSVGKEFYASSVRYIKLRTNSAGTTSACYTKTSRGSVTWDNAASVCPASTGVPTQAEFQSLLAAYGEDGTLYKVTGWLSTYWSSTQYPNVTFAAYAMLVYDTIALVGPDEKTSSNDVLCIVR